jgi:nitrogen fixation protein FixH
MAITEKAPREITGWHVLAIFVTFFAVIIAVNITLAWRAVSTFPGLEVENSYVASQTFDAERTAQLALAWTMTPTYDPEHGVLRLAFVDANDRPVIVKDLDVLVGRTTEASDDMVPQFALQDGIYVAPAVLARGKWMMAVAAHAADGTLFHQRIDLYVGH